MRPKLSAAWLSLLLPILGCGGGDLGDDVSTVDSGSGGMDAGQQDAVIGDAFVADTSSMDSSASETGAPDTNPMDTGSMDTGTTDTGSMDTGTPDVGSGMGCGAGRPDNDRRITISHGGVSRSFSVHLPPAYDGSGATPLVLNYHGRGSSAGQQILLSGMNQVADEGGFIAVHPEGVASTWNGGLCCGTAMTTGVDDVGFTAAMLDEIERAYCVDTSRVYATGLSNGGFMSHRLACDLGDRITAIAAVAGTNGDLSCSPPRAVPVLHIHGTADTVVRYDGFLGQVSVDMTIEGWRTRNSCAASASRVYDMGDVRCDEWACGTAAVQQCDVQGGGHQWFGGQSIPFLGDNTDDIDSSRYAWAFFQRFSL